MPTSAIVADRCLRAICTEMASNHKAFDRKQALRHGINGQKKALQSHSAEQRRTGRPGPRLRTAGAMKQGVGISSPSRVRRTSATGQTSCCLPAIMTRCERVGASPKRSAIGRGTTRRVAPVSTRNSVSSLRPVGPVSDPFTKKSPISSYRGFIIADGCLHGIHNFSLRHRRISFRSAIAAMRLRSGCDRAW